MTRARDLATLIAETEQGTWSPVLADAISGGNTSTGSSAAGRYVRSGKSVTVWGTLNNVNDASMSGTLVVQGLPYASSTNGTLAAHTGSVYFNACTWTNTTSYWVCEVADGQAYVGFRLCYNHASANAVSLSTGTVNNGTTDMRFTVTYETD